MRSARWMVLGGLLATQVFGHGFLHEKIQELSQEIALSPSADAYYRRAELERLHGDTQAALSNYDEVARREPGRRDVDLGCARTFEAAKDWSNALVRIDRFLAAQPEHGSALVTKARVLAALQRPREAVSAYDAAIAHHEQPDPDLFVERARAWQPLGEEGVARAVTSLEEGLQRIGPAVSLIEEAIRIETAGGRYDAALARIKAQLARSPRREFWLEKQVVILRAAGRIAEAGAACDEAIATIQALPVRPRETAATQELLTRLRAQRDGMKTGTSTP